MKRTLRLVLTVAAFVALARGVPAATPEQFRLWGSAGPELPAVPPGWAEVRPEGRFMSPPAPTAAEQGRGYLILAADPLEPTEGASPATEIERVAELKTFATPGEYEPARFFVVALEDLDQVRIAVSDFRSEAEDTIPSDHVDVRLVRNLREVTNARARTFRWRPFLLEKHPSLSIANGKTAQVWLTLDVPQDAKPGQYVGTVTVGPAGHFRSSQ